MISDTFRNRRIHVPASEEVRAHAAIEDASPEQEYALTRYGYIHGGYARLVQHVKFAALLASCVIAYFFVGHAFQSEPGHRVVEGARYGGLLLLAYMVLIALLYIRLRDILLMLIIAAVVITVLPVVVVALMVL